MAATAGADPEVADTDPPPSHREGWGIALLSIAVIAVAASVIVVALISMIDRGHDPVTVTYVVPEGTAREAVSGNRITIMPPEVRLSVGDTLVIRNEDTEIASVGPFTVRAGETLTQTFRRAQILIGECSLSGTGEVRIVVT